MIVSFCVVIVVTVAAVVAVAAAVCVPFEQRLHGLFWMLPSDALPVVSRLQSGC